MAKTQTMCAACGRKGHRYGRNEGMDRFDPQACINGLLGEIEKLREQNAALHQQAHLRRRYLIDSERFDVDEYGFAWATCCECHLPIYRHWAWSHEGGTPPQDHDADPGENL